MPEPQNNSFLIQRSVVTLKVKIQASGIVSVEPYKCKPENLRLWNTIARTQATMAQAQIDANKSASPFSILFTTFDRHGWDIKQEEEPMQGSQTTNP